MTHPPSIDKTAADAWDRECAKFGAHFWERVVGPVYAAYYGEQIALYKNVLITEKENAVNIYEPAAMICDEIAIHNGPGTQTRLIFEEIAAQIRALPNPPSEVPVFTTDWVLGKKQEFGAQGNSWTEAEYLAFEINARLATFRPAPTQEIPADHTDENGNRWNFYTWGPSGAYFRFAPASHPDDAAVDVFAAAMKEKMAASRAKGRFGWQQCGTDYLNAMLREHVEKGDMRDVANIAMMIWTNEGRIWGLISAPASEPDLERMQEAAERAWKKYDAQQLNEPHTQIVKYLAAEGFRLPDATETQDQHAVRQAKENDLLAEGYNDGFLQAIKVTEREIKPRLDAAALAEREAILKIANTAYQWTGYSDGWYRGINHMREMIAARMASSEIAVTETDQTLQLPTSAPQSRNDAHSTPTHHLAEAPHYALSRRLQLAGTWRYARYGQPGDVDWQDVAQEVLRWRDDLP